MNIFHKILQPLSRQAGVGYKILAVLATAEASAVLGALDSNLLCTSIRQASRGATAVIFGMKSFISLYANTIWMFHLYWYWNVLGRRSRSQIGLYENEDFSTPRRKNPKADGRNRESPTVIRRNLQRTVEILWWNENFKICVILITLITARRVQINYDRETRFSTATGWFGVVWPGPILLNRIYK